MSTDNLTEGRLKRGFDAVTVFRFVRWLSTPFEKWPAYERGVIDDEGNVIKPKDERDDEDKSTFTMYHRLIRNLKRLLYKVPFGKSRLASFAAALFLVREAAYNPFGRNLQERFERFMKEEYEFIHESYLEYYKQMKMLEESTPATSTGGMQGYDKPLPYKPDEFLGSKVFDVDTKTFMKSRYSKKKKSTYKRYIGDNELSMRIREYANQNPKKGVVLRDQQTGAMVWLKKPKHS